jgi:hypothetical protein
LGGGEVQQIQLRTEGRENGDLGFRSICNPVRLCQTFGKYRCIFHGTGNSAQLCQKFGISEGVEPPPPVRHCCILTFVLYNGSKSNVLLINLDESLSINNNKVFYPHIITTLPTKLTFFCNKSCSNNQTCVFKK